MKTAFKMVAYSWLVIFGLAFLMQAKEIITEVPMLSRLAAVLFLAGVISLGIVEFGWGGGDKTKGGNQ